MRKRQPYLCVSFFGLTCSSITYAENLYMFSLAGGVVPRYQGSQDYRPIVAPVFAAKFSNGSSGRTCSARRRSALRWTSRSPIRAAVRVAISI